MNSTKHKCPHCEEEYSIKWENEDLEPTTCPFCGGEASIEEDDVDFLDNEEEQDDWN